MARRRYRRQGAEARASALTRRLSLQGGMAEFRTGGGLAIMREVAGGDGERRRGRVGGVSLSTWLIHRLPLRRMDTCRRRFAERRSCIRMRGASAA